MNRFENIKLLGCTWYKIRYTERIDRKKNQSKYIADCPDKDLINKRKPDEILLLSHGKKEGRIYSLVSPSQLLKLVNKNRGIHEHILTDMKRKIYFDIDSKNDNLLVEGMHLIKTTFPNCRMNIHGYVNKNHKKNGIIYKKYSSFHIILDNYHLDNYNETNKLREWVKSINKDRKLLGEPELFDETVYKSQQLFKAVNQAKKKDQNNDGIEAKIIFGSSDPKDHLITCFFKENSKNATDYIPEVIEVIGKKGDKIKPFIVDLSAYTEELLKQPDKDFNVYTCTDKDLLYNLPNHPRGHPNVFDHEITFKVALYCVYYELSFKDFWGWACHKDNTIERKRRWFKKWEAIEDDLSLCQEFEDRNPTFSLHIRRYHIIALLECFYPNIKNDQNLRRFKDAHDIEETVKINSPWMSVDDFSDKKYHIVDIGMGGNKTGATIDYLKNINSFAWVSPRRTLATDTKARLMTNGIDAVDYRKVKKKKTEMINHDKLIINAESLHYLNDPTEKNKCKKFNVVVIDEIETVNNTWKSKDTHKNNFEENWRIFKQLLLNADKVILLDAFMTKKTIDLIKSLEKKEIEIYKALPRDIKRSVKLVGALKTKHHKRTSFQVWLDMIINDIKKGKKPFIFYPHKTGNSKMKSIEEIKMTICFNTGINPDEIPIYHADVSDKRVLQLSNVNDIWKNAKAVICNSSITVGVSYDRNDEHQFDNIYMGWASFLLARDMIQATARPRHLKEGNIYVFKCSGITNKDMQILNIDNGIYDKVLRPHLLIENRARDWDAFIHLCKLANYHIDESIYINDSLNSHNSLDNYQSIFDYDDISNTYKDAFGKIKKVDSTYITNATNNIYTSNATQQEKLIVAKYMFNKLFESGTPEEVISNCWNCKKEPFLRNYSLMLHTEIEWLHHIMKDLNITNLILPNKIELSKKTRDIIFKTFSFNRLSFECGDSMLLSRALAVQFNDNQFLYYDNETEKWRQSFEIVLFIIYAEKYLKRKTDWDEYMFD